MLAIMFTQSKLELFSHSGAEVRKSREIRDRITRVCQIAKSVKVHAVTPQSHSFGPKDFTK